MPIYEYRCKECGERFETLVLSEGEIPSCPSCGGDKVEKLISAPQVRMDGLSPSGGLTCCGREERCEVPPCSIDGRCRRG
ncbi:zinc ribbon domain-containing protein [Candidatus Poribacteria bacterium]|nr:MAG: zinc ribbon domain-containing protein [Candidatus Poribacteria bacterium]